MRHLIVCCDGTWQTPRQRTNVFLLSEALAGADAGGAPQVSRYFEGVGAVGSLGARASGGVAGVGLSRSVRDAYGWLAESYRPGDRIALFGFSRGAYTVRSLAGMITACGLLDVSGTSADEAARLVEQVYRTRYRARDRAEPGWRRGLRFRFDPDDAADIPVEFIGVWDTVGSLGIPDNLALVNLVDLPGRYRFHDVTLNPHIRHGRHAVALDESRGPFSPTLWADPAPGQDVRQVWFPGNHGDVGGGHRETGLSDGALVWMMREATAAVGLTFRAASIGGIRPDPSGPLHDDIADIAGPAAPVAEALFQPRPRPVPLIDPEAPGHPSVHESAYARQRDPHLPGGRYRLTRRLAVGTSVTVPVSARERWNDVGVYLDAGAYRFEASGRWDSSGNACGPAGEDQRTLLDPRALGQLVGTLIGRVEGGFRRFSGNPAAEFLGARRADDLPWMSLIGEVANRDLNVPPGQAEPDERIAIGAGTEHTVARPGYLYAFANDAWGFYGNNSGSVRLTVTRVG
jgi:Uncharacterized alpha/beta hydrolase domain (DUF2235)